MKKVAGRIKLELSQYRDLEAFAQFGSDLDADTQRTLARGERIVKTLNQGEREPLPVEDQVIQIFAATNGFLDRIYVRSRARVPDRADRTLSRRTRRAALEDRRAATGQRMSRAGREAIEAFAGDFGYDLDEEGQPLEDDEPRLEAQQGQRARRRGAA